MFWVLCWGHLICFRQIKQSGDGADSGRQRSRSPRCEPQAVAEVSKASAVADEAPTQAKSVLNFKDIRKMQDEKAKGGAIAQPVNEARGKSLELHVVYEAHALLISSENQYTYFCFHKAAGTL